MKKTEKIGFSLRVGKILHEKLTRHISLHQVINGELSNYSKWVESAINEKIEKDLENPKNEYNEQTKTISLLIDHNVYKKLEEKIHNLKSIHGSYSKKTWLIEAIQEKIKNESMELSDKMEKVKEELKF